MTYQVLARKYRPQTFSDVVGQEHITTTLKNAIAASRLHHAYLFTGARGIGKTTVARILAKALNCLKPSGSEPCNACGPCAEITNGNSLDVQEIDGASNNGVDEVRELREHAKYLPSSGKYKIYIIDEVHMLTTPAFNALLKTLEEPPKHVIFIFATTEAHKIPATILSRCQRHDFRRIPWASIAATLKKIAEGETVKIDDNAINLIAREATGSLRDAESLFDQAIAFSGSTVTADTIKSMLGFLDRKLLFDIVSAVAAKDPKGAITILDQVFSSGADLNRFAMDVLELLRHLLVFSECGADCGAIDLMKDEMAEIARMAGQMSAPELHQMFSIWYRTAEDVGRSAFPKMVLEVGLVKLSRVSPVKSIEEIISRIDEIAGDVAMPSLPANPNISAPQIAKKEIAPPAPGISKPAFPPAGAHSEPTFGPAGSKADVEAEKRWEEFMRFVVRERPQVAAIFQNGVLTGIDNGIVKFMFENPCYVDMLSEEERKAQVEGLFESFFKRKLRLAVGKSGGDSLGMRGARKKEVMREVLGSDIVRQAADILNARVHDIKVEGEK